MNKYHWHCTIYTHINHIVVMMKKVILFGNVIQYCLYTNIYILLLLLLCASSVAEDQNIILFANSTNYTCPKYLDIQQPSVFQGKFDPNELNGTWYMIATNEPTLPSFCKCGINTMDIHKNTNNTIGGWYHYTSRDICEIPISVNIKGKLSTNASTPGLLHENADIAGHIIGKLDPNYFFHVDRDNDGKISVVYSYACLGKIPFGKKDQLQFSFNILGRNPIKFETIQQIQNLVNKVNQLTKGILNINNLRYNTYEMYQKCGIK